jgi:hypothetical protein
MCAYNNQQQPQQTNQTLDCCNNNHSISTPQHDETLKQTENFQTTAGGKSLERASLPTSTLSLHNVMLLVLKFYSWGTSTKP